MELIFIRHGRTNANDKKIYATHDEPLSDDGKVQVSHLKDRLHETYPVTSSPYIRCQQTASILFPDREISYNRELREMSFGILEGHSFNEMYEREPSLIKPWVEDPFHNALPGGESIDEAYERVANFIDATSESSIFVTHDGVIRLALCYVLGSPRHFFNFYIENASTAVIEIGEGYKMIKSINGK